MFSDLLSRINPISFSVQLYHFIVKVYHLNFVHQFANFFSSSLVHDKGKVLDFANTRTENRKVIPRNFHSNSLLLKRKKIDTQRLNKSVELKRRKLENETHIFNIFLCATTFKFIFIKDGPSFKCGFESGIRSCQLYSVYSFSHFYLLLW